MVQLHFVRRHLLRPYGVQVQNLLARLSHRPRRNPRLAPRLRVCPFRRTARGASSASPPLRRGSAPSRTRSRSTFTSNASATSCSHERHHCAGTQRLPRYPSHDAQSQATQGMPTLEQPNRSLVALGRRPDPTDGVGEARTGPCRRSRAWGVHVPLRVPLTPFRDDQVYEYHATHLAPQPWPFPLQE